MGRGIGAGASVPDPAEGGRRWHHPGAVIVHWGLDALPRALAETGVERPLLVTSERLAGLAVPVEHRFGGVQPHADVRGVRAALDAARAADADGLVAAGGGSAIDTAKAVSAELSLPVISIPTTYSGAEWSTGYGSRDADSGVKRGGGGALVRAIVYEPALTLDLPRSETVGTALNALAHCAEALYTARHAPDTDAEALEGARLIAEALPATVADGRDLEARTSLLRGAMHAGAALRAGMGVGHAMAQALGGRYGLPHGTMNAICLPAALRFNADVAAPAIARLAAAMGAHDAAARVEELAALGGPTRLRDHGVPADDLEIVAAASAARAPALANPRPAPAEEILGLLRSVW
jgi:maleylacetate reductase